MTAEHGPRPPSPNSGSPGVLKTERRTRFGPGLRLQIVVALAGVILVAYVPLFFAIAQVTRATSIAYREDGARTIGRAIAAHIADVHALGPASLERTIATHVGDGDALAIAVYDGRGDLIASGGSRGDVASLRAPTLPHGDAASAARVTTSSGRALDVIVPTGAGGRGEPGGGGGTGGAVLARVRAEDDPARTAQLVRAVALYMSVFALALLFFAYLVLTRAIVRPIEQLARAADRVASGARDLELPASAAREVAELGASVRAMTARLREEERALRLKVDELTATTKRLSETREQLAGSERMASVGRLAAGVAHEIGNPIAAMMGLHDLIDDRETSDETRADFLMRMRKETERIHVVVRDLLDYARPEGIPESTRTLASVANVVDDVLSLVRPQKEFKSIDTTLEIEPGLSVTLSAQRLTQVLLNLLLNAGAALGASASHSRTIIVRARRVEGGVRIEIEDNGPGVPKDVAPRIFEPFVTTKDVGAGTGLGLAVCKGIVDGANGRIDLDPTYDHGARFVVELPSG